MRKETKPVASFFSDLADRYGFHHRSLAYGSLESQCKKLRPLIEIGLQKERNRVSVLDVGCGFGDLAELLKIESIPCRYKGIDISPKVVAIANRQRPKLDITQQDILEMRGDNLYDYVLCTGFNCVKTGCNWDVLVEATARMFELARKGVAIGAVSTYRTRKSEDTYYTSPGRFFNFCMAHLTKRVILRHDYLPHDFTMYLYK